MSENINAAADKFDEKLSVAKEGTYVFVTGGSGLIGSHLIAALLQKGIRVKALYRERIPEMPGAEKVEWVKGDILDVISLNEAFENVDYIYHCAAIVSYSQKLKQQLFKTNIEGTANVVDAALNEGVKKLCFVSSVAALGKPEADQEVTENAVWDEENVTSNYSKSKFLAEVEVWRGIAEGLNAVIVNPSIVLGAGAWNTGSTKIFKTAYEEFAWYTKGITGFVDVADVVKAMMLLTESDVSGERFILNSENIAYKDVFTLIAKGFNKKPPYKRVNSFLATMVLFSETIRSKFTGKDPILTKETTEAAQRITRFNNSKIKRFLPGFVFTPLETTIMRVCNELKERYQLP